MKQWWEAAEEIYKEYKNMYLFEEARQKKDLRKYFQYLPIIERMHEIMLAEKEIDTISHDSLLWSDDIKEISHEEIIRLKEKIIANKEEIKQSLFPEEDVHKINSIVMEIRAASGGTEASLFAMELYNMYSKLCTQEQWDQEVLYDSRSDIGGIKARIVKITGQHCYKLLRYEAGVHVVKRVPTTEKAGRIHTSTVVVAILKDYEIDYHVEVKEEDVRVDTYRSTGAGGQHVNTTSSGVRLTHLPTGTVVQCQDERSQHKNKDKAWANLVSVLREEKRKSEEAKLTQERREQMGTGERNEKIRSYNFPQDRVTDHRINVSVSYIKSFMEAGKNFHEMIQEVIEYLEKKDLS